MKRAGGTGGRGEPTVAPVPGTTLGLLRVAGVPLGPKQRVFDTPGVRHGYQLTTRLQLEEVSMVLPRRRLKPRTWRLGEGSSLLIGGLARVDVVASPAPTLYLTAYVSDDVVCHMGRTDGAGERRDKHVGGLLVPPLSPARMDEIGPLVPRDAEVAGDHWDRSGTDIAIAGVGWVAVGVKGAAKLRVWAPEGVSVTTHESLVPDYAKDFQRPGWSDLLPAKSRSRLQEAAAKRAGGEGESGGESGVEGEEDEAAPREKRAPRVSAAGSGKGRGRSAGGGGGGGGRGSSRSYSPPAGAGGGRGSGGRGGRGGRGGGSGSSSQRGAAR
jgi:hypothetical protein